MTYELSWLPSPPQLLEEPIPPERRKLIVERYMARHLRSGYFVQAKNEAPERAAEWIKLISQTHLPEKTFENDKFKIIYFRAMTMAELKSSRS